jgi:GntR family transcriptional regulator
MRALAADLGIAVGTVARAYTELESAGLVASRRRTGTVVTGVADPRPAGDQPVRDAVDSLVRAAHDSGADVESVISLARTASRSPPVDHRRMTGRLAAGAGRSPMITRENAVLVQPGM